MGRLQLAYTRFIQKVKSFLTSHNEILFDRERIEIARQVLEQHKYLFGLCDSIQNLAQQIQQESFPIVKQDDQQKLIASILLIRILEGSEAAILLAKFGFRPETWAVIRTLFEILCQLRIARTDMDFLNKYIKSDEKKRLKIIRVAERYPEQLPTLKEYSTIERKAKIQSRIKAEHIEEFSVRDLADKAGMTFEYDTFYMLASIDIHTSPRAWQDHVKTNTEGKIIEILYGPRDEDVPMALFHIADYVLRSLREISLLFGLNKETLINELHLQLEKGIQP